ncbi:hypothetical protein XAC3562_1200080 [Xanthomonas citri pv. citri]|uniref:Uncharacterized protein n=1 Tax=Xanthomonas citri pv. citri TaxID=611301 RepID=A0A0U5FCL6_XANCI|nr:hypothetical protein XAC3562_1200080 [Xanthomonas citri pv. citri]
MVIVFVVDFLILRRAEPAEHAGVMVATEHLRTNGCERTVSYISVLVVLAPEFAFDAK